jgi:hypothetical protein
MDAAEAELHRNNQLLDAASGDVASLRAQLQQAEHVLRVAMHNYTVALNEYQQLDSLRISSSSTSHDGARGSSEPAKEPCERRIAGVEVEPRKPVIEYESYQCGWRDDRDRHTRNMDPPIDMQIIRSYNFVVKVAGHHTPTGRVSNKVPCITCVDIHFTRYVRMRGPPRLGSGMHSRDYTHCIYIYIYIYIYMWVCGVLLKDAVLSPAQCWRHDDVVILKINFLIARTDSPDEGYYGHLTLGYGSFRDDSPRTWTLWRTHLAEEVGRVFNQCVC